jgi:hypothetical protein
MALASNTYVTIRGEHFSLATIPNTKSELVKREKEAILGILDLASLVADIGKLGNFFRVAENGVAGNTELQIKVQRVGYKITKLTDKSAITVHKFEQTSNSVLQKLQGTFQFLLDGLEKKALETLSMLSDVAEQMAKAEEDLQWEFEEATKDVIDALEDTQKTKGVSEERKKELNRHQQQGARLECVIYALHNSIGALKSLSAIMMNTALFWCQMQQHCKSLAKKDVQKLVEKAMKYPDEKRLKVWTSTAFKTKLILYFSKLVAHDNVLSDMQIPKYAFC